MARNYGEREIKRWIPTGDETSDKPTFVNFIPLDKGAYDKYINSLAEIKRNKVVSHAQDAFEKLCRLTITADNKGIFLGNIYWKEKGALAPEFFAEVKDKEQAIKICLGMNVEDANELEQEMRGQSTLSESEVKN